MQNTTGFDSSRYLENVTHMCIISGMRTETEGLQHYKSTTAKFVKRFGLSLSRFRRGLYAMQDCHGFTEVATVAA